MQPNLAKSSCVWSLQHLPHKIGRIKTPSLTWMSPAKELHICTRYLVVAMLLTLKQSVCVCVQNINYPSIKTWGLQWRLQISQLFPGSFTAMVPTWLGCFSQLQAVHTTCVFTLSLCFASWPIHNQSRGVTISPNQIWILDCVHPYSIYPIHYIWLV